MCFEWKNRYACGHIGFNKVERCPLLGTGCFGPDGSEQFVDVAAPCYDCRARALDPTEVMASGADPFRHPGSRGAGGHGYGHGHGHGHSGGVGGEGEGC
ncbi:hypothetical protein NEMBOFW57_008872 [Staphylotrichum longicolle]|uniref:Uncharacterized protein n=1 Tax=Staphylotrichum longicolle TaxID=669026 RepID=A0AAD4HX17_9PEZI|nr:hypothetical protein NEMBOFW57_008872 [Staphylotrichum longicolle]